MRRPARLPLARARLFSVSSETVPIKVMTGWALPGLLVASFGVLLTLLSSRFGYDFGVSEMPVIEMTAVLILAGFAYCFFLPIHISRSRLDGHALRLAVACIVVAGLAARLALLASEPILEDDYQRYLWDGAVTANGHNPYAVAPQDAKNPDSELNRLADDSNVVVDRINHASLKTVYPPVAQVAFGLAYTLKPWSLVAWRLVLLAFDVTTLALILLLLREVGRSPLWSALYWWNPLVIKELFNSAHMEAVVLPFVLGALFLAMRNRTVPAVLSLAVATGAKIWPVLLLPLILRGSVRNTKTLVCASLVFAIVAAVWMVPIWLGGIDASSGFVAYASRWDTNSALFPVLERTTALVLPLFTVPAETAGTVVRCAIAASLGALAIAISVKPIGSADELLGRASIVVAALVLLSPAQFPWYVVWFAPFLPFRPWFGFLLLTATAPLYYLGFYFFAQQQPDIAGDVIVWLVWVPVWAALIYDIARRTRATAREAVADV